MGSNNVSTWVGKTLYKSINYLTSFSFSAFLPALLVFAPSPGGEHGAGVAVPLAGTFLALASPLRGLPFLGPGPFGCRLPSAAAESVDRAAVRPSRVLPPPAASGPAAPSPPTGACSREPGPGRCRSGVEKEPLQRRDRRVQPGEPRAEGGCPDGSRARCRPRTGGPGPPTPGERRVQETDGAERPALNLPSAGAGTAPVPRTEKRSGARGQVRVLCRGRGVGGKAGAGERPAALPGHRPRQKIKPEGEFVELSGGGLRALSPPPSPSR